jgi:predicted HicB family RNase H-like nuclease
LPTQVLRETIDWGLRHGGGWRVDRRRVAAPAAAIVVRLEPEVRKQVHAAARAAGGEASAWVCHALAQVTLAELLAHGQMGRARPRAHDSRHYDRRYMLRLDDQTREKLAGLARHFGTSIAEVVRQLVAQAKAEEFPARWQSRARTLQRARPGSGALSP